MTLPVPTFSATVRGKKTNRVKVKRAAKSAGTALARYRKDPTTRGLDCATVCICLPVAELAALDALAERTQMARSHLIRQAVKHFAAFLDQPDIAAGHRTDSPAPAAPSR